MSHFFNYDKTKNKHMIYAFPIKNEKDEIFGYRPVVDRVDAETGGLVERISEKFSEFKFKIFSSEKIAREFAINFFSNLDYE